MVEAVLAEAGAAYGDLDLLATTVGPGTFTGLRVGLAAARGLAVAGGLPVVGVTTLEALAGLKPAGREDGVHTAGSSPQISDGAGAVLMMNAEKAEKLGVEPLARIVDSCLVGSDPEFMLTGPIFATQKLLEENAMSINDIDVVEINEAFAAVVLAWEKEVHPDMERVNPNGGAIALGHPLGGTGAILTTKAVHELQRTDPAHALVTMCCGGGLGTGTLLQRL